MCGCCVQPWIMFVWMLCSAVDNVWMLCSAVDNVWMLCSVEDNVCVDAVFSRG